MDIHPPEHPIRSVREFLLQLFTVTCGIVIAIFLESLVTDFHDREKLRRTRMDFLTEIQANRAKVGEVLADEPAMEAWLDSLLAYGQSRLAHGDAKPPPGAPPVRKFLFLPSAAWETAVATQVMPLMKFPEARSLATSYNRQAVANTMSTNARDQWFAVAAYSDYGHLPDDDARHALQQFTVAIAYAKSLAYLESKLVEQYKETENLLKPE